MANERIFLEMWNADTNKTELIPFEADDIDYLMEKEMIDTDTLGYAMDDSVAFEIALLQMTESNKSFKYSEFVKLYLSLTDNDIRITA